MPVGEAQRSGAASAHWRGTMSVVAFEPLDFHRFHREELPRRLRAGNGALAARAAGALGSLAFRLPDGAAYCYVPTLDGVDVVAGDAGADTVIEVEAGLWQNLVHELDAAAGLLYGGRARCRRGNALSWVAWEPALRAMWSGRPVYDPDWPAPARSSWKRARRGGGLHAGLRSRGHGALPAHGRLPVRARRLRRRRGCGPARRSRAARRRGAQGRQALVVGQERRRSGGADARDPSGREAAAPRRCRATRASSRSKISPTGSSSSACRPATKRVSA